MADLLICSNGDQLANLKKICGNEYIVATLKCSFYFEYKKIGEPIFYLESDEMSNYEVISSVLSNITSVINLCNVEKKYIYRLSYHLEGGLATEIDQLLQNIRLIKRFICENSIEKIFLVDDKENWKLNEAVFLWAYQKNLDYIILDESAQNRREYLYTFRRSRYNLHVGKSEFDEREHFDQLKQYLNRKNKYEKGENIQKEIGSLYATKNNSRQFQWELESINLYYNTFNTGIISFYDCDDNERFREKGIDVECLEDYFDRDLFKKNYKKYLHDCKCIADKLSDDLKIVIEGTDISEYLKRKVINYLERICLEKLYIDTCAYTFFRTKNYRLIESWGNTNFWQSNVIYANCKQWGTRMFRREIQPIFFLEEFEPYASEIAIRMWSNEKIKDHHDLGAYQGKIYFIPDYGWKYYSNDLTRKTTIKLGKKVKILLAPTGPMTGYGTVQNYWNVCTTILDRLPSKQCKVIFKNHPSIEEVLQTEIEDRYRHNEFIDCVDKKESIGEYLRDCDIVITSASTVIFDAIKAGKPVFSIVGKQEYKLICGHEENITIYKDAQILCDYLQALFMDQNRMKEELLDIITRQNSYAKKMAGEISDNGYKALHEVVRRELQDGYTLVSQ